MRRDLKVTESLAFVRIEDRCAICSGAIVTFQPKITTAQSRYGVRHRHYVRCARCAAAEFEYRRKGESRSRLPYL